MANKSAHKELQRIADDAFGERPKLTFCLRLVQQHTRKEGEGKQEWLCRVFLENEGALKESATERTKDREINDK